MRHLQIRVAGSETTLHPLVPTLTDESVFNQAMMMAWSATFDPDRATVLLFLDGALEEFERELQRTELVREYAISKLDQHRGYVYLNSDPHPTEWKLFDTVSHEPLIPVFPFPYHTDGSMTLNIIGPHERLQTAVESIPRGIETTIERFGKYDLGQGPIPPGLPDRQREALVTALELGYFDTPRTAARDEVAERLDCAPSTASEHLRKGQRRVLQAYFNYSV